METVDLWVYTSGRSWDASVTAAVGRTSNGGGTDLRTGERDLSFAFGVHETAALGATIVKLTGVAGVNKVEVHSPEWRTA